MVAKTAGHSFPMAPDKGTVDVDPGRITVRHSRVRRPIEISSDNVAFVVHLEVVESSDEVIAGRPVALKLAPPTVDANVALVLRHPVATGKFTFGAQDRLPITSRQRAKGVEASVVFLAVRDPAGLAAAVEALGVRPGQNLFVALRETFGLASPDEVAELQQRAEKARRRANAAIGLMALTYPPLLVVQLHTSERTLPTGVVIRESLWGYAVIAIVVALAAAVPLPPAPQLPRPVKSPPATAGLRAALRPFVLLIALAPTVGLVWGGMALHRAYGVPRVISIAPVLFGPAAWVFTRSFRRRRRSQATERKPLEPISRTS